MDQTHPNRKSLQQNVVLFFLLKSTGAIDVTLQHSNTIHNVIPTLLVGRMASPNKVRKYEIC